MDYFLLAAGFLILAVSGNFLVDSSVSLARHIKVSTLVIGVVIVSFGTSAPELIVSLEAALEGHPNIAIGNVVGSNIANIVLVLGFTGLIMPIIVNGRALLYDWIVMMAASLLFFFFIYDLQVVFYEGIIMLTILAVYIFMSMRIANKKRKINKEKIKAKFSLWLSVLIIVLSSAGLMYGARLLVESASNIARESGVSERIISVSLIAFGTSIPELAASVIAVIKNEADISVGNIVGSNLFNILAIIGTTSVVKDITNIDKSIISFDILWMLGIALLLFLFILPLRKSSINRWKSLIFLSIYSVYIYLLYLS